MLKTSDKLSGSVGALSSVTIPHNVATPSGYTLAGGWSQVTGDTNLLIRAFTASTVSIANNSNQEIHFGSLQITLIFAKILATST